MELRRPAGPLQQNQVTNALNRSREIEASTPTASRDRWAWAGEPGEVPSGAIDRQLLLRVVLDPALKLAAVGRNLW
jgi:hypothetical protein